MLRALTILLVSGVLACTLGGDDTPSVPSGEGTSLADRSDQPPVALNATSPVLYPSVLARERIEGTVLVRLFVDSAGRNIPDSIAISESSGYPALDSAALAGAGSLRFAPALRRGQPVAATFIQPIQFRAPGAAGSQ